MSWDPNRADRDRERVTQLLDAGLRDQMRRIAEDTTLRFEDIAGRPEGRYLGRKTTTEFTGLSEPRDGDYLDLLLDSTSGVVHRFLYRSGSASAHKWESVGGPSLYHAVETAEATSSTAYTDLTTVGPSITIPRAGDYEISWGAEMYNANTVAYVHLAALKFGAAATSDTNAVRVLGDSANSANEGATVSRTAMYPGLAVSTVVKMQYKNVWGAGTPNASFEKRWIAVRPIRIS